MGDIIFLAFLFNVLFSVVSNLILDTGNYSYSAFERDHDFLILFLGFPYWVSKILFYPLLKIHSKKEKKKEELKSKNDRLKEDIKRRYSRIVNIQAMDGFIEELKQSLSTDLYARAINAYSDMFSILIKCSDGEGNLDTDNFNDIIQRAMKECKEVVQVAWEENCNRTNEVNEQYCKAKRQTINEELENMINKNKEFKDMWNKS